MLISYPAKHTHLMSNIYQPSPFSKHSLKGVRVLRLHVKSIGNSYHSRASPTLLSPDATGFQLRALSLIAASKC
jgi:hypothetical protein